MQSSTSTKKCCVGFIGTVNVAQHIFSIAALHVYKRESAAYAWIIVNNLKKKERGTNMKKSIALFLILIACISLVACGGNSTKETYPSRGTTGETDDPVAIAKEKLAEAYDNCCGGNDKNYASLGQDKLSLKIDTIPNDSYYRGESDAIEAIISINEYLELPSSLWEKMSSTRALDGMQTQNYSVYTVTWTYHPDNGLEVIYEVNV